jgi:hypothetical protein
MTAVCIAGMHRSGSSMVARLLNICGLQLGPQYDIMPASLDNVEGHWENLQFVGLNDELLALLGGGWDYPPIRSSSTCGLETLATLRRKACLVLDDFRDCELWGWKDPRSSLVPDFWLSIEPKLKFVICLRHPLEVSASLQRRNDFSRARSLDLWREYNQRLLDATRPDQRIVTHYDAYFADPAAELRRVLQFVDSTLEPEMLDKCASLARGDLRHNRAYAHQLLDPSIPEGIYELYAGLCEEAGWHRTSDGVLEDMPYNGAGDRNRALQEQVVRLTSELEDREQVLANCQLQLQLLTREMDALHSCTSWHVTAPLRYASRSLPGRTLKRLFGT